jgi:hypothetical protein
LSGLPSVQPARKSQSIDLIERLRAKVREVYGECYINPEAGERDLIVMLECAKPNEPVKYQGRFLQ